MKIETTLDVFFGDYLGQFTIPNFIILPTSDELKNHIKLPISKTVYSKEFKKILSYVNQSKSENYQYIEFSKKDVKKLNVIELELELEYYIVSYDIEGNPKRLFVTAYIVNIKNYE
jgi:hypothetical protein